MAVSWTTVLHPDRVKFRPTYYVAGTVEILGQIESNNQIMPTPTRPRPYSRTYLFPADRLEQMLGLAGDLNLGHLLGYPEVRVRAPSDSKNFLPRNVGIFGTVGSGKSNTTQVLMEEATAAGWAVVVVDVEGEYVRMNEPTADTDLAAKLAERFGRQPVGVADMRVYVPSSGASDADTPIRFKVPISKIETHVLSDLLEMSEPQMRMLYPLFEKLQRDQPARARSSIGHRAPGLGPGSGTSATSADVDFTLQDMIDGLDESNNYPGLGVKPKPQEAPTAHALRSKLKGLGTSGVLDWNATAKISYLPVADLLAPGRLSVLDVSRDRRPQPQHHHRLPTAEPVRPGGASRARPAAARYQLRAASRAGRAGGGAHFCIPHHSVPYACGSRPTADHQPPGAQTLDGPGPESPSSPDTFLMSCSSWPTPGSSTSSSRPLTWRRCNRPPAVSTTLCGRRSPRWPLASAYSPEQCSAIPSSPAFARRHRAGC